MRKNEKVVVPRNFFLSFSPGKHAKVLPQLRHSLSIPDTTYKSSGRWKKWAQCLKIDITQPKFCDKSAHQKKTIAVFFSILSRFLWMWGILAWDGWHAWPIDGHYRWIHLGYMHILCIRFLCNLFEGHIGGKQSWIRNSVCNYFFNSESWAPSFFQLGDSMDYATNSTPKLNICTTYSINAWIWTEL